MNNFSIVSISMEIIEDGKSPVSVVLRDRKTDKIFTITTNDIWQFESNGNRWSTFTRSSI